MGYKRATETMKKLASALSVLALLATMTFGFSSCQQQNQPEQPKDEEPTLIGEWTCSSISEVQSGGGGAVHNTYTVDGWYYVFSEDKSFVNYRGGEIERGQWTLIGKSLILSYANLDDYNEEYIILTFEAKKLVLKQEFDSKNWVEYTYVKTK